MDCCRPTRLALFLRAARRGAVLVLAGFILMGGLGGCDDDPEESTPDGGPAPECDVDTDCNDEKPCTDETCVEGQCQATPVAEGSGRATQPSQRKTS